MLIKNHWSKLFKFILIKASYSFTTVFLFFLSSLVSLFSIIIIFSLKLDSAKFFSIFQYYVMVIYAIFLFIFVLMNSIKLFGIQFEDSSFLLLITKPYSRKTIILTQYLGLFVFSFLFITLNILILLVWGGILGTILKVSYIDFYSLTVLKLFLFLILFSILVITGSVTLLSFSKSQTVFLIFVIFCSLFLLGGLPYSLVSTETDNIQLSFEKKVGPYSIKQIKSAILFNQNYKKGLIKYPNLTTAIADFENSLSLDELMNYDNSPAVVTKRENFFQNKGFLNDLGYTGKLTGHVDTWVNNTQFNDKDVSITLSFNKYFFNIKQLKQNIISNPDDPNNSVKEELFQLEHDYDQQFNISKFMKLQKNKAPILLEYNLNKSFVDDGSGPQQLSTDNWTDALRDSDTYVKFSTPLRNQYDALFLNPAYILLRNVEDYIYNQILILNCVKDSRIIFNEEFKKYNNIINIYTIINYFNVIEQWNQLWTSFQGYYNDFWFKPLASSSIDFDIQKNPLFSYPDFKFHLTNDNKINTDATNSIQNNLLVILVYTGLCIILFGLSILLFMRKNLS